MRYRGLFYADKKGHLYTKLTDEEIYGRLMDIIKKENINYDEEGVRTIIFSAEGDMSYSSGIIFLQKNKYKLASTVSNKQFVSYCYGFWLCE